MKITTRHHRVAEHIACGESYAEAARRSGVSRTTTMRWLKVAAFSDLVESKRTESLEPLVRARQMMHAAVPHMVQTLIDVAGSDDARPSERITAATAILDRSGMAKGSTLDISAGGDGEGLAIQLLRSLRDSPACVSSDDRGTSVGSCVGLPAARRPPQGTQRGLRARQSTTP